MTMMNEVYSKTIQMAEATCLLISAGNLGNHLLFLQLWCPQLFCTRGPGTGNGGEQAFKVWAPVEFDCKRGNESESRSVMSDSLRPDGIYRPLNSPGQNTGVGSLSLLQGSSQPRDQTQVSSIAGRFFTSWATREAKLGRRQRTSQSSRHNQVPASSSLGG